MVETAIGIGLVFREQRKREQKLIDLIGRVRNRHEFRNEVGKPASFQESATQKRLVNRDLVKVFTIHAMEIRFNPRPLSAEQIAFHVFTIRIVNVCFQKSNLNFFNGRSVIQHALLKHSKRITP